MRRAIRARRSASAAPAAAPSASLCAAFLSALLLLPLLMALTAPVNHDEDQYVGAAALIGHAVIYRDFMSLQTPLHAYVFAPLMAAGTWAFPAMRAATALLASITLLLAYRAQRWLGAGWRRAMGATLLLLCCTAFQVGASVVRNDILPALLLTIAIIAAVRALRRAGGVAALPAGLAIGLAISAKASYAPFAPALCLGLLLLPQPARPRFGQRLAIGCIAGTGVLIGLLPAFLCWYRAPDAFWWGVVIFARTAPQAYYAASGQAGWLTPEGKLLRLLLVALEGPALAVMLLRLAGRPRASGEAGASAIRLLDIFTVAGLVAAFIPTPSWRQYLLPALPSLFITFGLIPGGGRARDRIRAGLLLFALVGLARPARDVALAVVDGSPPLHAARSARMTEAELAAAGIEGPVATVSIHAVLGARQGFDIRFATGPFITRESGLLNPARATAFHVAPADMVAMSFDRSPPSAILTGDEHPSEMFPLRQDQPLRDYAVAHAYRLHRLPGDDGELFIAPTQKMTVPR